MHGGLGMIKVRNLLVTALVLWGCILSSASAAVFTVNTAVDAVDSDTSDGVCLTAAGECSLRAAIQQANATAGADDINVPAGVYNLTLEGIKENEGATGDLDVKSEITINGSGADQVQIDGIQRSRVLEVHRNGSLTLNSLTVRNGWGDQLSSGGGIENNMGDLIINDCNITLNSVFGYGGGINNFRGTTIINRSTISENIAFSHGAGIANQDGNVTINDSTISDNSGTATTQSTFGGGIYNSAMFGILEINNSTISGHLVLLDGGGIYHLLGTLRITNSTISGNIANRNGGGLFYSSGNSSVGTAGNLRNVTIAFNTARAVDNSSPPDSKGGGGIYKRGADQLRMTNTIIAENLDGGDCYDDGQLTNLGFNLDSDGSCGLSGDATSISNGTAALGELADNGGPTLTHALLANSDALDAGDNDNCPAIDQRNYDRVDGNCDIGAYEEGAQAAPLNLLAAPAANIGTSSGANSAPTVLNLILAVEAGGSVAGLANGVDPDGDTLVYQIVQWPTMGRFGWEWEKDQIPGAFTYVANPEATGSDTITYQACDQSLCSDPATITIAISDAAASSEVAIEITSDSGGATVSPVQVVSGENLAAKVADIDYEQPLKIFFFSVNDIPVNADSQLNGTEITIQLPDTAMIDANAAVRKRDKFDVWRTLPEVPDSNLPNKTTGKIDHVAKTLTLVLYDNDDFDLNPTPGVILDPVAVSVSKATDVTDSSVEVDPVIDTGSGSGAIHPLILLLFGLLGLRWRRRP